MKYKSNEEKLESTLRITHSYQPEMDAFKTDLRNRLYCIKGLNILYLEVFFNAVDEEFQILGIFTYFGSAFWTYTRNDSIKSEELIERVRMEVFEWVCCLELGSEEKKIYPSIKPKRGPLPSAPHAYEREFTGEDAPEPPQPMPVDPPGYLDIPLGELRVNRNAGDVTMNYAAPTYATCNNHEEVFATTATGQSLTNGRPPSIINNNDARITEEEFQRRTHTYLNPGAVLRTTPAEPPRLTSEDAGL